MKKPTLINESTNTFGVVRAGRQQFGVGAVEIYTPATLLMFLTKQPKVSEFNRLQPSVSTWRGSQNVPRIVQNVQMILTTGFLTISSIISHRRNAVFGHIARLNLSTAHNLSLPLCHAITPSLSYSE